MYVATAFCLLGLASAQTVTQLASCFIREDALRLRCKFVPVESPLPMCWFMQGDKIVASINASETPDPANRVGPDITIQERVCEVVLHERANQPKDFKCAIKQTSVSEKSATLQKRTIPFCCAFSVLQENGSGVYLLLLLTLSLFSDLF